MFVWRIVVVTLHTYTALCCRVRVSSLYSSMPVSCMQLCVCARVSRIYSRRLPAAGGLVFQCGSATARPPHVVRHCPAGVALSTPPRHHARPVADPRALKPWAGIGTAESWLIMHLASHVYPHGEIAAVVWYWYSYIYRVGIRGGKRFGVV